MITYKCQKCAFSFNQSDKAWDEAVMSGNCPKCNSILANFVAITKAQISEKLNPSQQINLFTVFTRTLGGAKGVAILALFANAIFIEHKSLIPIVTTGYFGPVAVPLLLYLAVAFITYAIGGQRLLHKLTPWFTNNHNEKK